MFSLAAIGSTIANSPAARWAIGVGLAVLIFLFWLGRYTDGVRKTERIRMERRSIKTQKKVEEKLHEKSKQVERARQSAPRGIDHVERVPDELFWIISDN